MAYDISKPAGADALGASDETIRENFRALKDDKIVNAYKLNDFLPGNASGNIPISNGTLCTNLNADLIDGMNAGNASGNIAINNGTLCTNLNAQLLNGNASTYYLNATNINAGLLEVTYGGTGQSAYTKGDIIVASGTSALAKLAVGTNDQMIIADSSQTSGMKWGKPTRSIIMSWSSPGTDEVSHSIRLPIAYTASLLWLNADTAPTASTTIQIYKNGTLLDSLAMTTIAATKSVAYSFAANDVIYAKISGAANGLNKLTAEIVVS